MTIYRSYNQKIADIQLTTSVNRGVRGLGKYLPVASLITKEEQKRLKRTETPQWMSNPVI